MTGKDVKEYRKQLGMTRKQFAELVGYTDNYIWYIETGKRNMSKILIKLINKIKENPN